MGLFAGSERAFFMSNALSVWGIERFSFRCSFFLFCFSWGSFVLTIIIAEVLNKKGSKDVLSKMWNRK
jgi:hypothetical protein